MAKIYIKGNYFFIEKDGRRYDGLRKEVKVYKNTSDETTYFFEKLEKWKNNGLNIQDIQKENGDSYTQAEWETFYTENTGSFKNGGGNGTGLQSGHLASYQFKEDLPNDLTANDAGKSFLVREPSGGVTFLGRTFGGNESGIYIWDGSNFGVKPVSKLSLDALDVILKTDEYSIISQSNLREGLKELETEINKKSEFWNSPLNDVTSDFRYKGGMNGTEWQINKYERANNMAKSSATVSINSGITALDDAWSGRLTINYI